jgi:prepilin-type N-terminal cleavage/methylation domain-containing protein
VTRRGMTLVEMLVAMTATLLLMAAVAQAFSVFGSAITGSRGILDLDGRLRGAAWRLRTDLSGATVRPLPPISSETAQGYLEVIEGQVSDTEDATTGSVVGNNFTLGPTDVDDVLLLTTQSTSTPFLGRAPGNRSFESTVAEVAWFARLTPGTSNPPTYTLYRKQLLVMGYVGTSPFHNSPINSTNRVAFPAGGWASYFESPCDVSVRRERRPNAFDVLIPNTLADLTRREARFMHNPGGLVDGSAFPYEFVSHQAATLPDGLVFGMNRVGEDIVLTDVLTFDVRVFDAAVAVTMPGTTPLVPGDQSYGGNVVGTGAYVDIGHGAASNSILGASTRFHDGSARRVGNQSTTLVRTYDTWTLAYEANGRDEDAVLGVDQAFNGQDDSLPGIDDNGNGQIDELNEPGNGLVDDPTEFETRPPYPYPLRGIEVRIRCYEPSSRQVRQVTVRHTFVPH